MLGQSDMLVLGLYICATIALVALMIGLSSVLGGVRDGRSMRLPFESGVLPVTGARLRLPVQYYVIAMFFVIFDMEAVFIFAWALVVRQAGWAGYGCMMVFLAVLLVAFAYLWRVGALEWGPRPYRAGMQRRERTDTGRIDMGRS
ncbi:NADH-quinone oxidoreductase subunit A [Lichenicoccus roseus]|uniref:NADH-quinone oxidoreductase subunit A n=2 Tax=Lichenicoccus roseus TaxID=2683649 RepID=A0A5R9J814_9PROT|nr:NADH-quinone oxidoreductase subunit A [Lichenicoccus roseus]